MANKKTHIKVIHKKIKEEPQASEDLGFQTDTVREGYFGDSWMEKSGDKVGSKEHEVQEEFEICMVKEEAFQDSGTEESRDKGVSGEAHLPDRFEAYLVKGDVPLEDDRTENSGANKEDHSAGALHRGYLTNSFINESLEHALCSGEEDDGDAKEMETSEAQPLVLEEVDYQTYTYFTKERPLDIDCTAEDVIHSQTTPHPSRNHGGNSSPESSNQSLGNTQQIPDGKIERLDEPSTSQAVKLETQWDSPERESKYGCSDSNHGPYCFQGADERETMEPASSYQEHIEREDEWTVEMTVSQDITPSSLLCATRKNPSKPRRNNSAEKPFQCSLCDGGFSSKGNLNKHLRMQHCQCPVCNKIFSHEDILSKHVRTHRREKSYHCTICTNGFTTKSNRNKHVRLIHIKEGPRPCPLCKKLFSCDDILARHLRRHHGQNSGSKHFSLQPELGTQLVSSERESSMNENGASHITNVKRDTVEPASSHHKHGRMNTKREMNAGHDGECDENFEMTSVEGTVQSSNDVTKKNNPSEPGGNQTGEKLYQCTLCNKELSNKGNLNKHLRDMHFQCPVCNKMFSNRDILSRHVRTHRKPKSHQCSLCNKGFSNTGNLNKHMKMIHAEEGKPVYECSYCNKSFSSGDTLTRHVRTFHERKSYHCSVCNREFSKSRNLKEHKRTHTGEKPYLCTICNKEFSYKCSLSVHLRLHTGQKPYTCKCTICDNEFTHWNSLNAHKKTHTGEKMFRCTICSKGFIYKNSLTAHIRAHTGEKPHHCSVCGVGVAHRHGLLIHMRRHSGEKPYQCSVCNKRFAAKRDLKRHIRTHTGEKHYMCSFCSKRFITKNELILHERIHTGEKPFQCTICHKRYARNASVTEHMKNHIISEKPYCCPVCLTGFPGKHELKQHMKSHTKENSHMKKKPFKSSVCDIGFSERHGLSGKIVHCHVCNRRFARNFDLNRHVQTHKEEKPYQCLICSKSFARKSHLLGHNRSHTGEELYRCSICNKAYSAKFYLKLHMRIHTEGKPYQCEVCLDKLSCHGKLSEHMKIHAGSNDA